MARKSNKRVKQAVIGLICVGIVSITGYYGINEQEYANNLINNQIENIKEVSFNLEDIPDYNGGPYVVINNNIPVFTESDYTTEAFEKYSELDNIGRKRK